MKNALLRRTSELENGKNIAAVIALNARTPHPSTLIPRPSPSPLTAPRVIDAGASLGRAKLAGGGSTVESRRAPSPCSLY